MARLTKKRTKKVGLPPGTLIHTGEAKTSTPAITVIDYDETHLEEKQVASVEECYPFKEKPTVTWINLDGVHRVEVIEKLGNCFGLHPLVLEDILNTDQRPKIEIYGDYIYIVLKMIYGTGADHRLEVEQASLILGANFVLSFQEEKEGDVFNPVRDRIRTSKGLIRKMGADYLAYSLIDTIVDNYFLVLEKLGDRVELLEEALVANPTEQLLQKIQTVRNEISYVRRAVWPVREVIGGLSRRESPLIQQATEIYLRDVYDHTVQLMDTIEIYREMISGMLDIYLSGLRNRLSAVMKVLTIIATIFMPLTFIAGIYGMNFEYMPELKWRWGYPAVLVGIVIIGISMVLYFKKKKWI